MTNTANVSSANGLQPIDCLGIVLAGGLSSRMGQDKAMLKRNTLSSNNMLSFSKQLLADSGLSDIVTSGDNHQIPDLVPQSGPVGGIYSVLAHYPPHLQPKALLILPVDLPLMTASDLSDLRLKGELSNKATFFKDTQKQAHHIPLYLPNNAFLQLFLAQVFKGNTLLTKTDGRHSNPNDKSKSGPSIRGMLEKIPHQAIASSNSKALFNSNTPQEWLEAKKHF